MSPTNSNQPDHPGTTIIAGQRYRHFKGGIYEIIGVGIHTETDEEMVFYRDSQTERLFARPLASFLRPAVVGEAVSRFVLVEEGHE